MSGTEFAREKERVAAIMKDKQAKGEKEVFTYSYWGIPLFKSIRMGKKKGKTKDKKKGYYQKGGDFGRYA